MYILATLIVLTTYKCPNKTHTTHQPRGLTRPEDEGRTKGGEARARERERECVCVRESERDAREGLAEGGPHVISSMEVRGSGVVLQYRCLNESLSNSIKKQIKTTKANYDDPC